MYLETSKAALYNFVTQKVTCFVFRKNGCHSKPESLGNRSSSGERSSTLSGSTKGLPHVGSMLGHRLPRWPNIDPTSSLVFIGPSLPFRSLMQHVRTGQNLCCKTVCSYHSNWMQQLPHLVSNVNLKSSTNIHSATLYKLHMVCLYAHILYICSNYIVTL